MQAEQRVLVPPDFVPGIYPGESDEVYFRRPLGVASNSTLKMLDGQTPGHYLHYIRSGEDADDAPQDTEAQIIGRAFHCRVLEEDQFSKRYREQPDFGPMNSARNRARLEEWRGYQPPGITLLWPRQMRLIEAMRESLLRHKVARLMLERGKREVVFRSIDRDTGLACKGKVDLWDEELAFFLDLKSCMSAHPADFGRTVAKYRYYVQHAAYSEMAAANGAPIRNFLLVPVEKTAPHFSAVYHLDTAAEERGFEVLRRSLAKLRECMDKWIAGADLDEAFPAYGNSITQLSIPGWAYSE